MKKIGYLLIFIHCFFAKAQQASSDHLANTLQTRLSARVLNAYQENATTKVEDLFHYFELLTDVSLDVTVKKEIIRNINQLFNDQNPLVLDVTSASLDPIPLQLLVQKLVGSEPIFFKVSNENQCQSVTVNSWQNNYTITKTQSGLSKTITVNQTIFMNQTLKQFGTNSKEVWISYLGEMH